METRALLNGLSSAAAMLLVAGCSGASGLTTGSVLGGGKTAAKAEANTNTPMSRALQVGATSARAVKCGYNFDPAKLRQTYIAAEASAGLSVAEIAKLEKVYDTSFNGVSKAVKDPARYCTAKKTTVIKADLTRHLGGDYSVPKRKVAKADDTLFGWLNDAAPDNSGPKFGSDDWWEKQRQDSGK